MGNDKGAVFREDGALCELRLIAKGRMSEYRYVHTVNVAARAAELAGIYGENEYKAYRAGLLHDICKDVPKPELLALIERYEPDFAKRAPEWYESPALWHSRAGALYAEHELKECDPDILNAVRFHTSGRTGMSRLEEIIYLADLTSAERDYPDVEVVRKLSERDIGEAMLYSLKYIIGDLVSKGAPLTPETAGAYNQYAQAAKR